MKAWFAVSLMATLCGISGAQTPAPPPGSSVTNQGNASGAASASGPTATPPFPANATVLVGDALKQKLAGKAFKITLASGEWWRVDYKDNGYVYLNTRSRSTDTGKWRVEGGNVCAEWGRSASGCTEYRMAGNSFYTTWRGQIIELVPD